MDTNLKNMLTGRWAASLWHHQPLSRCGDLVSKKKGTGYTKLCSFALCCTFPQRSSKGWRREFSVSIEGSVDENTSSRYPSDPHSSTDWRAAVENYSKQCISLAIRKGNNIGTGLALDNARDTNQARKSIKDKTQSTNNNQLR